jgi:hypothetical protein
MNRLKNFVPSLVLLGALLAVCSVPRAGAEPNAVSPLNWYIGTIQADLSGTGYYDYGVRPSIAVHPLTGSPHVSFYDAGTLTFLSDAFRLETVAGSCNGGISNAVPPSPPSGWHCPSIDATGDSGYDSAVAFETSGAYGIAYNDPANGTLTLKRYDQYESPIGTSVIASSLTHRSFASLAFNGSTPYVAYNGWYSSGTGLYANSDQITWYAAQPVVATAFPSIDVGSNSKPRIAFRHTATGDLRFAEYTGSGSENSCPKSYNQNINPNWACSTVDVTVGYPSYISHHASKSAQDPTRIAYYDTGTMKLKLATYTGSGSCGNGASAGWKCEEIDSIGNSPSTSELGVSLAIVLGFPVIAYIDKDDQGNSIVKLARYVASGGNCGPSNTWYCEVVDNGGASNDNLESAALAYANGIYYIAYHDKTQRSLKVAHTKFTTAPTISMSYSPNTVFKGNKTRVTYTITNNMTNSILGGMAFNNGYSTVATFDPASLSSSCVGTVAFVVSNHALKFTNGILGKSATCAISVDLTMNTAGTWSIGTTALTSEASDAPAASDLITVKHGVLLPHVRR